VDQRNSGLDDFTQFFHQLNEVPLKKQDSHLKLQIYVDNCSVEVFANDGETVISSEIYPNPLNMGIELFSNHGNVKVNSIDLWELKKSRFIFFGFNEQ
jgi:sucrose-6-phosphate hydrolase SacC (GH32 family)